MIAATAIEAPAGARFVRFPAQDDARGKLVIGELDDLIPFVCRRIFMVHGVPAGIERGAHAHRECHQLLIATSGSVTVRVDDGRSVGDVRLDDPALGLYLPPMTWGEQRDYSPNCTLLVLASHPYAADDYIHDYAAFCAMTRGDR